jgi:hypothetical protein
MMQTKTIGECPRCARVTFRTEGWCESGVCLRAETQLVEVPCCQWDERGDRDAVHVCPSCGNTAEPTPLNIWPLRACQAEVK